MTNGLGGNVVEFDIKDVSDYGMIMYKVDARFIIDTNTIRKEVDDFIKINYPDHDCLKYGCIYLLRNVDYMDMALKLRF